MLLPFCLISSKADSVSKVLTGSPAILFTSQEEKASGVGVGPGNMKLACWLSQLELQPLLWASFPQDLTLFLHI